MKILNIKILHDNSGTDIVFLYTDLPESTWPYKGNQVIDFKCAKDTAVTYCMNHFEGINIEIIGREFKS